MSVSSQCRVCAAPLGDRSTDGLCARCLAQGFAAGRGAPRVHEPEATIAYENPAGVEQGSALHLPDLEVIDRLGKGGMGVVYLARQVRLDRLVAVKLLPEVGRESPVFRERFEREARTLARLNHPHIVTLFDCGEVGGIPYLVMEYVEGTTLRRLLQNQRLQPEHALRIALALCEALEYAHQEGIIHRDVKPENVLLDVRGRVKLADFGLAKLMDSGEGHAPLTMTHQVVGTLHYMAPEQREPSRPIDHRADIYALGVVLYEMFTGRLPLGRFPPPSQHASLDPALDPIVLRALSYEADDRQERVADLRLELERVAAAAGVLRSGGHGSGRASELPLAAATRSAANGLLASALAGLLLSALVVIGYLADWHRLLGFRSDGEVAPVVAMTVFNLPAPVLVGAAGVALRCRRFHWAALVGSWIAILPVHLTWPLTVVPGARSLTILRRTEPAAPFR